ncbi:MAG: hypothetical protein ABEH43_02365 [Flavobacteriales bacterium]
MEDSGKITKNDIKEEIDEVAELSSSFFIGKTDEIPEDRLNAFPTYENIRIIAESGDKETIEWLEEEMIKAFKDYPEYDNEQAVNNVHLDDKNEVYRLYVVFILSEQYQHLKTLL